MIAQGAVHGHPDRGTCSFKGIPYAAPPVGALRFRPPAPPAAFGPPWEAATFGSACSQISLEGVIHGAEDCLTLNVWAPAPAPRKLPVLLFVHGGGNVSGSSADPTYDGAGLSELGGLVVVTVEYRLSALGYLAHPALSKEHDPPSSGNYGWLDEIAALSWVHENIDRFGGDPERVTLLGQSAGARAVCAMLVSPLASGWFHRAWIQSGTCDYASLSQAEASGTMVAELVGCADAVTAPICLREVETSRLLTAAPSFPTLLAGSTYNPNVDGWSIPKAPLDALASGGQKAIPIVIGSDADEVAQIVPEVVDARDYAAKVEQLYGQLAPAILAHYPLSEYSSGRRALGRIVTDERYTCSLNRTARVLAQNGESVYRGWFSHGLDSGADAAYGAFHGLELRFLFRTLDVVGPLPSAGELELSNELIARVAAFAASGDPNPPGKLTWPKFDAARGEYLNFTVPVSSSSGLGGEACAFWDSL